MHRRIRSFAPIGGSLLRNAAGSTKNQKRKYAMTLQIYSTLSKDIRPFTPIEPGKVGMYVCGVTVYDYTHIGHGRTFVAFDVVRRWLEASGYAVTFVRNVTDVDDKIIKRAAERGISTKELTDEFTAAMQQDMLSLGCLAPTYEPRATEFIPQMLNLVEKLEQKGLAYAADNGDVDYAVRKFAGYGKLSGRQPDEMRAGGQWELYDIPASYTGRDARAPASKWLKPSAIRSTSYFGRPPSRASPPGIRSGARGAQAGTSSARP